MSIGRYVLSGGEPAGDGALRRGHAQAPRRARRRALRPGESYSEGLEGLPEYPHYTRPAEYRPAGGSRRCCSPPPTTSADGAAAQPQHQRVEDALGRQGEEESSSNSSGCNKQLTAVHTRSPKLVPPAEGRPLPLTLAQLGLTATSRRDAARPPFHEQRHPNDRARATAPCSELRPGRPREGPLPGLQWTAPASRSSGGGRDQAPGPRRARDLHRT